MPMRKKITPEALHAIRAFLDKGLSSAEIAAAIGITVGTLRVKCSQMGISLRRQKYSVHAAAKRRGVRREPTRKNTPPPNSGLQFQPAVSFTHAQLLTLRLPRTVIDQLQDRGTSRGLSASKLASMLLEVIARDDLYAAVLDSGEDVGTLSESEKLSD